MRLLQLVDEPFDSGIVHYALTLSQALQRRGHAVFIGGRSNRFPLHKAHRLGLGTRALRSFPGGTLDLRRILERDSIELVNAHTGSSHTLAVAAAGMMDRPVPVVRTRGDSRPLRRSWTGSLLWRRTSGFIAPTRRILEQFKSAYPRVQVLSCAILQGIDAGSRSLPRLSAGAPSLQDGPIPTLPSAARPNPGAGCLDRPENEAIEMPPFPPLHVGLLGRLDPVKGHATFIRAAAKIAARVPEARFLIAGREENVRIDDLRRMADRLGLSGKIIFQGHAPDAAQFMRGCHVGVVASLGSEAVSRAALEWMAAGRPLIATEVGSLPEIVEDGETGFLVPPGSSEAMASRIGELLADADLRSRMGRAALARFQRSFSLERFAAETERFYESILLSCHSTERSMANANSNPASSRMQLSPNRRGKTTGIGKFFKIGSKSRIPTPKESA